MDAVEPHWADVLGGLAWLLVVFELDVLFWLGALRLIGVL